MVALTARSIRILCRRNGNADIDSDIYRMLLCPVFRPVFSAFLPPTKSRGTLVGIRSLGMRFLGMRVDGRASVCSACPAGTCDDLRHSPTLCTMRGFPTQSHEDPWRSPRAQKSCTVSGARGRPKRRPIRILWRRNGNAVTECVMLRFFRTLTTHPGRSVGQVIAILGTAGRKPRDTRGRPARTTTVCILVASALAKRDVVYM